MFASISFRSCLVLACVITASGLSGGLVSAGAADEPITIGSRKQLFIDHRFIASSRNVTLRMNPPYQTGEVLITADQPHEESRTISLYSSVVKHDGLVRVWYDLVGPGSERCVCYAESKDGIHFTKPELGLHELDGSTANNVVIPGVIGGCSVWIDPKAPPEHRFKTQAKSYQPRGFLMHSSPDGVHWDLFAEVNPRGAADTQTIIFWDWYLQRYVFYGRDKRIIRPEGHVTSIRMIRRQESDDLKQWDTQSRVLEPDAVDLNTYETPSIVPPVDYYGATVFKYPWRSPEEDIAIDDSVYLMLAQAFWHFTDRGYGGALGPYTRDVRLAVSRDGKNFRRAGNRKAFLRPGRAGQFNSKQIWALPNPIQMGDEIWIYYAGTNEDRTRRDNANRIDPRTAGGKKLGGIGRAVMRLDGFISADAPYEGGEFVTPLLRFAGTSLELNVDTAAGGSVLVELLDEDSQPIAGYTREQAIPVNGNSVRMPVSWGKQQDVSSLAGRAIRIRFIMRDCKLYAFQFRDS